MEFSLKHEIKPPQQNEVAKLEIENERLKKGYLVKGVGAAKEFVTGKEKNSKSSMHLDPDIQ